MSDLNEFVAWVKAKPKSRLCKITIEQEVLGSDVTVKVWAYDLYEMSGQMVNSVSEIDLPAAKEKQEREQYEKLKAKYAD